MRMASNLSRALEHEASVMQILMLDPQALAGNYSDLDQRHIYMRLAFVRRAACIIPSCHTEDSFNLLNRKIERVFPLGFFLVVFTTCALFILPSVHPLGRISRTRIHYAKEHVLNSVFRLQRFLTRCLSQNLLFQTMSSHIVYCLSISLTYHAVPEKVTAFGQGFRKPL